MTRRPDVDRGDYSPRPYLKALDMTQADLGRLAGASHRTGRRWCTDRPEDTPRAVRVLLDVMCQYGIAPADLLPPPDP